MKDKRWELRWESGEEKGQGEAICKRKTDWNVRKEDIESTRQRNGERKGNIGRRRKRKEVEASQRFRRF